MIYTAWVVWMQGRHQNVLAKAEFAMHNAGRNWLRCRATVVLTRGIGVREEEPLRTRPMNPKAFIDLHSRLGLALWHIQACEDGLVHFIAIVLQMPPSRAREEAMKIIDRLQSRTLGGLIREMQKSKSTNSVSEFEFRVNRFLGERNWLVHQSWREHHADLFNPERLPPLYGRLDRLAQEASDLQHYFSKITSAWTRERGVSKSRIEKEKLRILREKGVV
ncbi:MAG: hypothetical protein ISS78_09210 [Phycisphaerae bacterium]|nr:hypothetical protein [Phycisphaerae bacterium]